MTDSVETPKRESVQDVRSEFVDAARKDALTPGPPAELGAEQQGVQLARGLTPSEWDSYLHVQEGFTIVPGIAVECSHRGIFYLALRGVITVAEHRKLLDHYTAIGMLEAIVTGASAGAGAGGGVVVRGLKWINWLRKGLGFGGKELDESFHTFELPGNIIIALRGTLNASDEEWRERNQVFREVAEERSEGLNATLEEIIMDRLYRSDVTFHVEKRLKIKK